MAESVSQRARMKPRHFSCRNDTCESIARLDVWRTRYREKIFGCRRREILFTETWSRLQVWSSMVAKSNFGSIAASTVDKRSAPYRYWMVHFQTKTVQKWFLDSRSAIVKTGRIFSVKIDKVLYTSTRNELVQRNSCDSSDTSISVGQLEQRHFSKFWPRSCNLPKILSIPRIITHIKAWPAFDRFCPVRPQSRYPCFLKISKP